MLFVYMTASSFAEAKHIATQVVTQRLAAGANILPGAYSIYHWQGEIVHSQECICIFKSTQENFAALQDIILRLHSYKTPCIIALPMQAVEENFGAWIQQECSKGLK